MLEREGDYEVTREVDCPVMAAFYPRRLPWQETLLRLNVDWDLKSGVRSKRTRQASILVRAILGHCMEIIKSL